MEEEVHAWICTVTGEEATTQALKDWLKDGTILCRVINTLAPGSAKCKASKMPFVQMENIAAFLQAVREQVCIPEREMFSTVDLYEGKSMRQVIITLASLSRHAFERKLCSVDPIGPKYKSPSPRPPTQYKPLLPDKEYPGWSPSQVGYNRGATQGNQKVSFGAPRPLIYPSPSPSPSPAP